MPAKRSLPPVPDDALELVASRFRLLGDPSRLRILNLLMQESRSVQALVEASGLSQTNVSRHLGLLRREGVVGRTRDGNRAIYHLADTKIKRLCEVVCSGLTERLSGDLGALGGEGI